VRDHRWSAPPSAIYADTGRIYGVYTEAVWDQRVRACVLNGRVHFKEITGIDYGLYNFADMCTVWRLAQDY
jgi:hypothetical protein